MLSIARRTRWFSGGNARRSGSSDWRITAIGVLKACALSSAARRIAAAEPCSTCTIRSNSAATSANSGKSLRTAKLPVFRPRSRIWRAIRAKRRSPRPIPRNVDKAITTIAR